MKPDIQDVSRHIPGAHHEIDPLLFPSLELLYDRRLSRLNHFKEHAGSDEEKNWLSFLSAMVARQKEISQYPLRNLKKEWTDFSSNEDGLASKIALDDAWLSGIDGFMDVAQKHLLPSAYGSLKKIISDKETLQQFMLRVLHYDYSAQEVGEALFVRLVYSSFVTRVCHSFEEKLAVDLHGPFDLYCPFCRQLPVGGVIAGGGREGLRYLQCSVCELRWHKVRGVCLICDHSDGIKLWDEDSDFKDPIQIETCQECSFYMKQIRHDIDPLVELVSDDQHSLKMDRFMNKKKYHRLGVNPFFLPVV